MRWSCLLWGLVTGLCVLFPEIANAEGLFYQLPEDGSWARFDVEYTYKIEGVEPGQGAGTLMMASAGKAVEASEPCRWIEFDVRLKDIGPEQILLRKLLIPERYLTKGQNPTEHVVRGWAKFNDEPVEPAVPFHGRWPAYLAGPLHDEKKLDKQVVQSKLGVLECEGVSGWMEWDEGDLHMKVTLETRLHEQAPFGVVSSRMVFEVTQAGKVLQTVDGTMTLSDESKDARTALPDHK